MIGLVDGNNFFVSCERVFNPSLEGKPVAVLSNNDGCCISRSNEFKVLNIPMGTPFFQLKERIRQDGLILLSSNYELYSDLSGRVIATLSELVPKVEQYSIDEAFIYPPKMEFEKYEAFGKKIRSTIFRYVGIPCGVGFAPTKTLAKIANHIGKKSSSGVFVMPSDPRNVLENTPIEEVWGVGRRLAPKLERMGIRNAWKLATADIAALQKKFSIILGRTIMELRGTPCIEEELPDELSKSISCSRSFGQPVISLQDLEESIASYTAKAAEKLRREGQTAAGASFYFEMYPEYEPVPLPAGRREAFVSFPSPTDETGKMLEAIRPFLEKIYLPGRRYKKSGVLFFGLESIHNRQGDLFAPAGERDSSSSRLYQTIDKLNAAFGKGTIFTLAEGIQKPWQMRREMLSPHYTTSWEELLKVK